MTIQSGDRLPEATFLRMGDEGPEEVTTRGLTAGRKVVIFGMPGAFTRTCSAMHLPSIIDTAEEFREKGVDELVVVTVNDPHVVRAWSDASGAAEAGVTLLADADGAYTRALGLAFDAPAVGFFGRTTRHALVVEDGVVSGVTIEEGRGTCDMTGGRALLDML